jgi:hypothetical protein
VFGTIVLRRIFRPIRDDAHRKYPYFDEVVGLAWSNDLESYAGSRVATGRGSLARQVKDDDHD